MTDQLSLYNRALEVIGETPLASLTERRGSRRALDRVWGDGPTGDGGVRACLEQGQWNFAMRTVQASYDPDVSPSFGYARAFSKPDDWVITAAVCTDEFFKTPLIDYADETVYWYAEFDTLYFKFVSNLDAFGGDMTKWPESFTDYVASYFAFRVAPGLTKDPAALKVYENYMEKMKREAKSSDAWNQPPQTLAPGRWVSSRRSSRGGDRGNRGTLIG